MKSLRQRHKLNPRQETFLLKIYAGTCATRAYWETYRSGRLPKVDSKPYNTVKACAARMLTKDNVAAALDDLRAKDAKKAQLTRDRKREILCDIAEAQRVGDPVRAINEDNRMTGEHAAEKFEGKVSGEMSFIDIMKASQRKPKKGKRS